MLAARESRRGVLLQRSDRAGLVVWKAFENVDEYSVGLGDVEADVWNWVGDELLQDREDGLGDDGEGEGWSEDLKFC